MIYLKVFCICGFVFRNKFLNFLNNKDFFYCLKVYEKYILFILLGGLGKFNMIICESIRYSI